jgi:dienelactone hydrolase
LRAHASQYKIDKKHIGAVGFSAGGNLACMLGSTDGKEFKASGGNPDQSDLVQAVISFYGMLHLPELDPLVRLEARVVRDELSAGFPSLRLMPGQTLRFQPNTSFC